MMCRKELCFRKEQNSQVVYLAKYDSPNAHFAVGNVSLFGQFMHGLRIIQSIVNRLIVNHEITQPKGTNQTDTATLTFIKVLSNKVVSCIIYTFLS